MVKIIDTHTHYAHRMFKNNREEVVEFLPWQGIMAVVEAAIGYDSNLKMLELCEMYSHVYASVGVHPVCVEQLNEEKFEKIKNMLSHPKVIAIGETGLDYARRKDEEFVERQKTWFRRFLELSLEVKMPLVIHSREADEDLIRILSEYELPEHPGIIHCFSGTAGQAKQLMDMGFFLGIGGKFLKHMDENEAFRQVVKDLPLDKIVLETDAPFLKPDALPGKVNTSLNLRYIAEELAKLKAVDVEIICEAALKNTQTLYGTIVR